MLAALARGHLSWRRTALDRPLALLVILVLLQVIVGNRSIVAWALGPPASGLDPITEPFPTPFFIIGTVAPWQTLASFGLFLQYAALFYLVVNHVRDRRQVRRLVLTLLATGAVLGFAGLVEHLSQASWLLPWRGGQITNRLTGPFVNPDHFGTWLAMLVCLGIGAATIRRSRGDVDEPSGARWRSREWRERILRRHLPLVAVVAMTVALVLTLSRGVLIAIVVALLALVALIGVVGRMRLSLVVVGALVAVTLGYVGWIGMAPLLERLDTSGQGLSWRWVQYRASVPMLSDFPVLGVGLGAYKDIYARYQPLAHAAGSVYYPYAHNDLLQFVIETGWVGGLLFLYAAVRLCRDLVGAHLLGRTRCPVGAGAGEAARREDPHSVGLAIGALAGIVAMVVHSTGEFSARIPANGWLAAALLGIATVALHTRFRSISDGWLPRRAEWTPTSASRKLLAASAIVATLVVGIVVVRSIRLDHALGILRATPTLAAAEAAVAIDPREPRALVARAVARVRTAMPGVTQPARRREADALFDGAIGDLRAGLASTPTDPGLHERLASVYASRALFFGDVADTERALAHFRRAIVLEPENPSRSRALAQFALTRGEPLLDVAVAAASAASARAPELLPLFVGQFRFAAMSDARWLALAPATFSGRLHTALLLEDVASGGAASVARGARELAREPLEVLAAHWATARALLLRGDHAAAARELDAALGADPAHPDMNRLRGDVFTASGDPRALDAYRAAVEIAAQRMAKMPTGGEYVGFPLADAAVRRLIVERAGSGVTPHRRALATYLERRGLSDQAIAEWERVVEAIPNDAVAHFRLGVVLERVGRADRALEAYRRAVALEGRTEHRLRLAERLWKTDQFYQAILEWQAAIGQEPRNIEARLALARAYTRAGDVREALQQYYAIVQIDPNHPAARAEGGRLQR